MDLEQLVINLIKDDLVHYKLANGLVELGLNPREYLVSLHETIFWLMGFKEEQMTDQLIDSYFLSTEKIVDMHVSSNQVELDVLARDIYTGLKTMKERSEN